MGAASLREDRDTSLAQASEGGGQVIDKLRALRADLVNSKEPISVGEMENGNPSPGHFVVAAASADDGDASGPIWFLASTESGRKIERLSSLADFEWRERIDAVSSAEEAELLVAEILDADSPDRIKVSLIQEWAKRCETSQPARALLLHETLFERFFLLPSSIGTPVGLLSGIWLIEHDVRTDQLPLWLGRLGERCLLFAEPFTVTYLDHVAEALRSRLERLVGKESDRKEPDQAPLQMALEAALEQWAEMSRRWERREAVRSFHRLARIELGVGESNERSLARLSFRSWDLLVWRVTSGTHLIGRPFNIVKAEMDEIISVLAEDSDFRPALVMSDGEKIGISGDPVVERADIIKGWWWPSLEVVVGLADAQAYFESARRRQWQFGLLIGVALVSVGMGLWALYRSLRQQEAENERRSNFVASVSHELRTPASSISLLTEELVAGGGDPKTYHELIHAESQRLAVLVENVLDVSRIERGKRDYFFEPCDLACLIESTLESVRPMAARYDVRVLGEGLAGEAEAEVDPLAIQRALRNLLDNAIKFSVAHQAVRVVLSDRESCWEITVMDQGPGIARRDWDRVFESFQRLGSELRRETQGVGLGLALVKHVVDGHGGRVTLASELGEGCHFAVSLPKERGR